MVRVLSSEDLPVDPETGIYKIDKVLRRQNSMGESFFNSWFGSLCCIPHAAPPTHLSVNLAPVPIIDKLIIHFHGGGFVSMSSGSHQNYTRIWANDLGVPVFSVDYRLSPQ